MKLITSILILCCMAATAVAQNASLSVTTTKTTSLIFPFTVKHVDRGSKDILVEQVKDADNILLVKAASPGFSETNLTVITEEGSVYAFKVNYVEDPYTLLWQIPSQHEASIRAYANCIIDNPRTVHSIHTANFEIYGSVSGIYTRDKAIYFQLQLTNRSTIDYDIDDLRFSIRDRKKAKRTASQEIALRPLHVAGNTRLVKAGSSNSIVLAFPKFTIPDAKFLTLSIKEHNGARNLSLRVSNRKLVRATPLPDLH